MPSPPELANQAPHVPELPLCETQVESHEASPVSPLESESALEAFLFQAIGTFRGQPEPDKEGKFFLRLGGQSYRLFIPGYRHAAWLKQLANHPDTPLFVRVYPKCLLIPRKDPIISFQVAAWGDENQWDEEPGIFRFKGIWQFVPQLRTPVISVYRNRNATDPLGKFKASHLPVLMRREDDTRPFKFNPKVPKEELPKRWFIQARFKFIPSRNCWGWVEDLAAPTEQFPKYKKPVKAEN